jgi:hypothetical protein
MARKRVQDMADRNTQDGSARHGSDLMEDVQSVASKLADTAQEKARGLAGKAQEQALRMAEEKKRQAAEQVEGVARVVDSVAEQVESMVPPAGSYVRGVADEIERVSSNLRDRSVEDLMDDARRFAQERPATVLLGAVVAGFALARFMKASADRGASRRMHRASSGAGPRPQRQRPPQASEPDFAGARPPGAASSTASNAAQGSGSDGR